MCRILTTALFVMTVLGLAAGAHGQSATGRPSQGVRLWTQVHGRIEAIRGTRLTLKTDTGERLLVDTSPMGLDERRDLMPGRRMTLIGYLGERPNEFVAWFVPMPETPAASPAQPERAEATPRPAPDSQRPEAPRSDAQRGEPQRPQETSPR